MKNFKGTIELCFLNADCFLHLNIREIFYRATGWSSSFSDKPKSSQLVTVPVGCWELQVQGWPFVTFTSVCGVRLFHSPSQYLVRTEQPCSPWACREMAVIRIFLHIGNAVTVKNKEIPHHDWHCKEWEEKGRLSPCSFFDWELIFVISSMVSICQLTQDFTSYTRQPGSCPWTSQSPAEGLKPNVFEFSLYFPSFQEWAALL